MAPLSTIKRLPPELRAAIEAQLAQGRTLDDVTAAVRAMGAEVSRSAIGRYKQRMDALLERSRTTREIASVLANTVGKGGTGELIRGNAELLHGVLLAAVEATSGDADSKDAMMLAIALEKLASAAKKGAELERLEADAATAVVDAEAGAGPSAAIEVIFVDPKPLPEPGPVNPETEDTPQ